MTIDNRKDYLLLLLYAEGITQNFNEPIIGRTRLVKLLFVFKQEMLQKFKKNIDSNIPFYDFYPWHYGPFSKQVYDDIKFFELRGFISYKDVASETTPESVAEWEYLNELEDGEDSQFTEYVEQEFTLTEKGMLFASKLYGVLTPVQRNIIKDFKARMGVVPLRALLKYVYTQYPEFTSNSLIKNNILGEE